jgi:hypothetical protein
MRLYILLFLIHNIIAELLFTQCAPGCQNINSQAGDCSKLPSDVKGSACYPTFDMQKCIIDPYITESCTSCINPINGIQCPINCNLVGNECISTRNNTNCQEKYDWKCPIGCNYNQNTGNCEPKTVNDVCNLVEQTLQCPKQCQYNNDLHRCFSSNINTICEKQKGLICTSFCSLNPTGTTCIKTTSLLPYSYYPCNYTSTPSYPCNSGCTYSEQYQRCLPNTINDICEPLKIATCPKDYYFFDSTIEKCTITNQDKLCILTNNTIRYPTNIINNHKCKFKLDIDCSIPRLESCGSGCFFDKIKNKCIPPNKTMMCGSSFDQNVQIKRFLRFNNTPCQIDTIPATIFGNPYCVSKWYYDT